MPLTEFSLYHYLLQLAMMARCYRLTKTLTDLPPSYAASADHAMSALKISGSNCHAATSHHIHDIAEFVQYLARTSRNSQPRFQFTTEIAMRYFFFLLLSITVSTAVWATDMLQRPLTLEDAKHLLNRTGFGATADELNRFIGLTRIEAVETIVNGLSTDTTNSVPDWVNNPAPHHWLRNELPANERRIFNEARDQEIATLRSWWLREMIETGSPQTEKLVLFWHNHFATAYSAINDQAISIARQHLMFRQHSAGNFRTLLKSVIRDPALLNFLDNDNSRVKSPNENFARELLELFTLGEGNYSESDIKNAARALTGYGTSPTHNLLFQFKPARHDSGAKTLFGHNGKFNGDDLVDLILQQPAVAPFITAKLWAMLVSDVPPLSRQLQPLAAQFMESNFDIKTLYRAILHTDAFWHEHNRSSIVHSPVSLTISAIRSSGILPQTWQSLPSTVAQLGQNLFDPPNVAGWPGGGAWISPGRLLNRLEWLASFDTMCTEKNCADNSMAAVAQTSTMAPAPSTMMPAATAQTRLSLRLAAEHYLGPAKYRVDIQRGHDVLWSSGETRVIGGHDTKRFGRLGGKKPKPWQIVHFSIDIPIPDYDKITIHFLNDTRGPGGDRSLFVDWAQLNQQRFEASDGIQKSKCPPKQPRNSGTLLCNGVLEMSKLSTPIQAQAVAQAKNHDLRVSGVYMRGIQNPARRSLAAYEITLTDVEFDQRTWHNLTVSFQRDKNNNYRIALNNYGCWPDCSEQWPSCARQDSGESAMRWLTIPLHSGKSGNCQYHKLTTSDQKLIRSLWQHLPEFYRIIGNSKRVKRGRNPSNHQAWRGVIDNMYRNYLETSDTQNTAALVVVPHSPVHEPAGIKMYREPPMPGGRSNTERTADLKRLLHSHPQLTMVNLLLPVKTTLQGHDDRSRINLGQIFTDLSFQLY